MIMYNYITKETVGQTVHVHNYDDVLTRLEGKTN